MMIDFDVEAVLRDLAERVSDLEAKADEQESVIEELRLGTPVTARPLNYMDDDIDEFLLGEWD